MKAIRRLTARCRNLVNNDKMDQRLREELAEHLALQTEENIRAGMEPRDARRQAVLKLGPVPAIRESYHAETGFAAIESAIEDARFGARILRRNPVFTAVAIISLSLAIGANTTIFSLTKQLLYARLNIPHAEGLRLLAWTGSQDHSAVHHVWGDWNPIAGGRAVSSVFSYPAYQQMRADNRVLDDLFAFKRMGMIAQIGMDAQRVRTDMVSGNYFADLEVRPQLGRAILPSDDAKAGDGAVAVISDECWERLFGRSATVLGATVKLDDIVVTIVGVGPKDFTGVKDTLHGADFFVPLSMQPLLVPHGSGSLFSDPKTWWVSVMGRTKPGVSDTAADAALNGNLSAIVRGTMPVRPGEDLPQLEVRDGSRGLFEENQKFVRPMAILEALVGLVLMLACANLATLTLARGARRIREMSVRFALGARRSRVVRQLLVENLLLAAAGGVGGLITGYLGRNAILAIADQSWDHMDLPVHFDWMVIAFTGGVTLLTGILFGVAPAFTAAHIDLNSGLKETSQTSTRRRRGASGKPLVAFQIALSMLLVVGAGLFWRTLAGLNSVNVGFQTDHLLLAELDPPHGRYPAGKDIALHQRMEEAFSSVPGVASVTLARDPYIADDRSANDFLRIGEQYNPNQNQEEDYNVVGDQFFATLGIPILEGRGFTSSDTKTSRKVAVINVSLARKRFPGQDPVGKQFVTDPHDSDGSGGALPKNAIEIVGVCGDTHYMNLREQPPAQFFLPYVQLPSSGGMVYEIRTSIDTNSVLPQLRQMVHQVDPDLGLTDVRTQQQQIDSTLQDERILVTITSGFGILALALAAVGIYGIMAYSVAQRMNEMGIRLALGASRGQVIRMVLSEASFVTVSGIAAGLVCSFFLTRMVTSMLYGIGSDDMLTLVGTSALLMAVSILASWIPARRAASVHPIEALRQL